MAAVTVAVAVYRGMPDRRKTAAFVPKPMQREPDRSARPPAVNEAHEAKVLAMALEKKPGHTPVLFKLATIEVEQGHYQDAERHLSEIVRKEPGNPEARLELGKVLFQLGDIQGAIEQTEAILKTRPSYADALYNLGAIYGNLGNRERAEHYWNTLIALDPGSENGRKAQQMLTRLQARTP